MKTAERPSGDTIEFSGATEAAAGSVAVHVYCWRSQVQRRFCTVTVSERLSFESSNVWNGSRLASTRPPETAASAVASLAWLNTASRVRRAGSTRKKALPAGAVVRYQN